MLGYDLLTAQLSDPELDKYQEKGMSLQDVILVSCHSTFSCFSCCFAGTGNSPWKILHTAYSNGIAAVRPSLPACMCSLCLIGLMHSPAEAYLLLEL